MDKTSILIDFIFKEKHHEIFVPVTLLWKGSSQARFLPSIDTHLKQAIPSTKHTKVLRISYFSDLKKLLDSQSNQLVTIFVRFIFEYVVRFVVGSLLNKHTKNVGPFLTYLKEIYYCCNHKTYYSVSGNITLSKREKS
jgi:hypothetical protein